MRSFETFQPKCIEPNSITSPRVFNGMCLIRKYKVTVEEVEEDTSILVERLLDLWNRRRELRITHSSNISAMRAEAAKLGIELR